MLWTRRLALLVGMVLLLAACPADEEAAQPPPEDPAAEDGDGVEEEEAPPPPDAPAERIRFSNVLGPASAISRSMEWWMQEVQDRTGGAVQFEHVYGGALLGGPDTLPGIGEGRAEAGFIVPAFTPAELPIFNIGAVPLDRNPDSRARAQHELLVEGQSDILRDELVEQHGVVPLVVILTQDYLLGTAQPIDNRQELEGMRVRVSGLAAVAYESAFGIEAVWISAEEVYESVQRGVIDGVTFPLDVFVDTGVHEVAPNFLIHGIGSFGNGCICLNADLWERLPEDVKDVMREVSDEFYAQASAILMETEEEACDSLLEAGGQVYSLPSEDIEWFQNEVGTSLIDQWKSDVVAAGFSEDEADELWDQYWEYVEQFEGESQYERGSELCAARS